MTTRQAPVDRLPVMVDMVRRREGSKPPGDKEIQAAHRILGGGKGFPSVSVACRGAKVYHADDDGKHHLVVVYKNGDVIDDAECSCGSAVACGHLLAVLTLDGGELRL